MSNLRINSNNIKKETPFDCLKVGEVFVSVNDGTVFMKMAPLKAYSNYNAIDLETGEMCNYRGHYPTYRAINPELKFDY